MQNLHTKTFAQKTNVYCSEIFRSKNLTAGVEYIGRGRSNRFWKTQKSAIGKSHRKGKGLIPKKEIDTYGKNTIFGFQNKTLTALFLQ